MIGAISALGLSVACSDASLTASASSVPSEPCGFVSDSCRATAKAAYSADGVGQGWRIQSSDKALSLSRLPDVLVGARADNGAQSPFVKLRHWRLPTARRRAKRLVSLTAIVAPAAYRRRAPAKSNRA